MTKNGTAKDQKGTMPHFVQSSLVQRRCHCQLLSSIMELYTTLYM